MFAVVGLDCLLPGAAGVDAWIRAEAPTLTRIPAGRWPGASEPATTEIGGFVEGFDFDSAGLDLEGWTVGDLDPLFAWVLHVVRGALPARRGPTALVLANLALPSTGHVRATTRALAEHLGQVPPWLARGGADADRWQAGLPAQLAARALHLDGPVDALDAACASGLHAVEIACARLAAHEVDVAVAAAANRADSAYLFKGFSALQALSPSGVPRPLDARADGLVVGEGAAAVALKRLADAVRDGDRIHAVIRGTGLGCDGRKGNMLAPAASGQLRALRAAWGRADRDPADLGYIECHATGTRVGDGTELAALEALLDGRSTARPRVAVGSAKGLVGHTVTAAGLAGLLRAIGAVRDGFRPAAPGCEEPRAELASSERLVALTAREPWPDDLPRLAAVSAFGFGGTNAHLVVEAAPGDGPAHPVMPATEPSDLAVVAVAARIGPARDAELLDALRGGRSLLAPAPLAGTRGVGPAARGAFVEVVDVDPTRWRVPPVELAELLPQQLLALDVASDALHRTPRLDPARTASLVAMEVDAHVSEAVLRWALLEVDRSAADQVHPPLTASRVQGSLPNFVANRIAAQHGLEGPSYAVGGGASAGLSALDQARLLLVDPALDAVVVGAVDLPGHVGVRQCDERLLGDEPCGEGAVVLVVRRRGDAVKAGDVILATLRPTAEAAAPRHRAVAGRCGAADALVDLLSVLASGAPGAVSSQDLVGPARAVQVIPETPPDLRPIPQQRTLRVPHSGPVLTSPAFLGAWGTDTVPRPLPRGPAEPARSTLRIRGELDAPVPLPWPRSVAPPPAPARRVGTPGVPTSWPELAEALAASTHAAADAHGRFLDGQERVLEQLATLGASLERAAGHLGGGPAPKPRTFDRAALLRHAGGPISSVFGPGWADLDGHEPRVRMPLPPLLLVDRVTHLEGERGVLGPARVVTEYDVPQVPEWSADGRPPAFVVVESGQADLFLVSFLGIDSECRGERVYRLLDCDLEFQGERPEPGTTLRHDIRIDRFARLGATTLFYFHYDCATTDGRPVLSMRNGCAGFFTPAELATPRGLRNDLPNLTAAPVTPLVSGAPGRLDDDAVRALAERRFSDGLGLAFAAADGAALTLPASADWRLVHRVKRIALSGPPHGLGEIVFEQDLRDDDWFNSCHFQGDPCMPGTLMLEGCLQAVQVWLLAVGVACEWPEARFEPVPGRAMRLRCRGQVVPGHHRLTYHARVTEASLEGEPYAVADVTLSVDGTPVVVAHDVGVRVVGERRARAPGPVVDRDRVLAYSVGSAVQAFGLRYARYDGPGKRCARMPGPPILQMSRVLAVEGAPGEVAAPRSTTITYDVPEDAFFWRAQPGSMPFAVLLETALQPCGWLTAWQGSGLLPTGGLYFRNLGGTGVQHAEVWPWTGTLVTTARQTSVSSSGGMTVMRFDVVVRTEAGELVFECETQFGYFTMAALRNQKGLPGVGAPLERTVDLDLAGHPALPRDDWRMLDRVVLADVEAGRYAATKRVDPSDWYFSAHFWLDPVMPGSLGLEALQQLARWVHHERTGGAERYEPLPLGRKVEWLYRGQVLTHNTEMTAEIEVLELDEGHIRCRGLIRADGMPIYRFDDLGVRVAGPAPEAPAAPVPARCPAAALLDTFDVQGDQGVGTLRLDPASHPWLDHHRPTLAASAVPMAVAAEIAAEAASLLRPGLKVVGLPSVEALRWIDVVDEPVDLTIVAVAQGDIVAVSLAVGSDVRMRAVVSMGATWPAPPPPLEVDAPEVGWDGPTFFASGRTFHGPVMQGMTRLDRLGSAGAVATLSTRPDADRRGGVTAAFVLDPLLLDSATHPMLSGQPEHWAPELAPGFVAYPVHASDMTFFGPRPDGDVTATLRVVHADRRSLVFDVELAGPTGPWCRYQWREVVLPGGPVLGTAPEVRRAFLWEHEPVETVRIGRATARGWEVRTGDLVEPLAGTLARLYCPPSEVVELGTAADPVAWTRQRIAAREAIRTHLRARMGRDIHPQDLVLARLTADELVVLVAATLTADEYIEHLGPTRFHLRLADVGEGRTEAWIE